MVNCFVLVVVWTLLSACARPEVCSVQQSILQGGVYSSFPSLRLRGGKKSKQAEEVVGKAQYIISFPKGWTNVMLICLQAWKETEELRKQYDEAEECMDEDLRTETQKYFHSPSSQIMLHCA